LNAGVWFRRDRLFIVAPDSRAKHACRQAEIPLSALYKPADLVDATVPLRCRSGRVRGIAREVSASNGFRLVCYCNDCQTFALPGEAGRARRSRGTHLGR
jgi:hypothetical protein